MGDNYFRVALTPSASNGLDQASEIQVDKVQSVRREKIDRVVGEVTSIELETVDELLRRWLDL